MPLNLINPSFTSLAKSFRSKNKNMPKIIKSLIIICAKFIGFKGLDLSPCGVLDLKV